MGDDHKPLDLGLSDEDFGACFLIVPEDDQQEPILCIRQRGLTRMYLTDAREILSADEVRVQYPDASIYSLTLSQIVCEGRAHDLLQCPICDTEFVLNDMLFTETLAEEECDLTGD